MNKSISGLAMILITSGTAHPAAVTSVSHDLAFGNAGAEISISGDVITTVQEPPATVIFTPQRLLSKSATQIAAIATVSGTHNGSEYVLGTLTVKGDDSTGYDLTTNSSWINTAKSAALTGSTRAIVSDGGPFYVTIVHNSNLPLPGETHLTLQLSEYTK
ncbi:hypothetical protein F2D81_26145 [Salmonella enterica]|nr:hypothetical protein [Salmonella enterica]EEA0373655.1 hypothetical protein [Salmonella enterica]